MSEYGRMIEPTTIRFERLLPGPIERVWAYLTDPERRSRWLAGGAMELRVGGAVELRFDHSRITEAREPIPERYAHLEGETIIRGVVTACEPPRRLSWTWEGEEEDSEATFELTPEGDRVRLVLTHRRLDEPSLRRGAAAGWHAHLDILGDELAGEDRRPFWSLHSQLENEYATILDTPLQE